MFPHDMRKPERKNFNKPDIVLNYPYKDKNISAVAADVFIGRNEIRKLRISPGFRWTIHDKPLEKTDLCMYGHLAYVISGKAVEQMKDGTEAELDAGVLTSAPPGHDLWVVGNEPWVAIEQSPSKELKELALSRKTFETSEERKSVEGAEITSVDLSGFIWHKVDLQPGFRAAAGAASMGNSSAAVFVVLSGNGVFTMAKEKDLVVSPDDVVYMPENYGMRVDGSAPLVMLRQKAAIN